MRNIGIFDLQTAGVWSGTIKSSTPKVPLIFTNGVFDLYHAGHVRFLNEIAAEYPGKLFVAINSDDSVQRLKGKFRPIIPQEERAEIVLSHREVAAVGIFEEETPLKWIETMCPDVLVKGGDYENARPIVGERFVESYNGTVAILPLHLGKTMGTTKIIEIIKNIAVKDTTSRGG